MPRQYENYPLQRLITCDACVSALYSFILFDYNCRPIIAAKNCVRLDCFTILSHDIVDPYMHAYTPSFKYTKNDVHLLRNFLWTIKVFSPRLESVKQNMYVLSNGRMNNWVDGRMDG